MGNYDGFTGTRIKFYRTLAELTQKELGRRCGVSESAIRNYELGNRLPDKETLKNIAYALEINPAVLEEPNPTDLAGTMNILYSLESMWGLHPVLENDTIKFEFGSRPSYAVPYITEDYMAQLKECIKTWISARNNFIGEDFDSPHDEDYSDLDYFIWTSQFPMSLEEDVAFREAHKEIYESEDYKPLYKKFLHIEEEE